MIYLNTAAQTMQQCTKGCIYVSIFFIMLSLLAVLNSGFFLETNTSIALLSPKWLLLNGSRDSVHTANTATHSTDNRGSVCKAYTGNAGATNVTKPILIMATSMARSRDRSALQQNVILNWSRLRPWIQPVLFVEHMSDAMNDHNVILAKKVIRLDKIGRR